MAQANAVSHTRYVLTNRLATPFGALLILIIIGRHSDTLLGQYALVMTFYYIMQMLPLLGLTSYVMREVARSPGEAGKYFTTVGFLSMLGCVAINLVVLQSLAFTNYEPVINEAIVVTGILIFPGILLFIAEVILMSLQRSRPVAMIAIAENTLRVVFSTIVLVTDGGLVALIWVFFTTRLLALMGYLFALKRMKIIDKYRTPDPALLIATLKILPPFLMGAILFITVSRVDFLVISLFETVETIGYYAIAYRFFEIFIIVLTALIMAIFPWISKKFVGARLHYIVALRALTEIFLVGLAFTGFAGLLFSEYYVAWLFPNQFPHPVLLTQLFVAILLLIGGLDYLASGILHASDLQVPDTKASAVGGLSLVLLLFVLVPAYGIYGAFLAKVIATAAQGGIKFIYINRLIGNLWRVSRSLKIVFLCVCLGVVAFLALEIGFFSKFAIALFVLTLLLPLSIFLLGLFQPMRLIRFYWHSEKANDVDSISSLIDVMITDQRQRDRYIRSIRHIQNRQRRTLDFGAAGVTLYRIARFFQLTGKHGLASGISKLNVALSGFKLSPSYPVAPGFVVYESRGANIADVLDRAALSKGMLVAPLISGGMFMPVQQDR